MIKRIKKSLVLFIQVDGDCSTFWLSNNERFSCSKSLREIMHSLPPAFVRIRHDCVVNTNHVSEFRIKRRTVLLFDGSEQEVSFRNIKPLTDLLLGKPLATTCPGFSG